MKTKKNYVLLFVVLLFAIQAFSQKRAAPGYISQVIGEKISKGLPFKREEILLPTETLQLTDAKIKQVVKSYQIFMPAKNSVASLLSLKPQNISVPILLANGSLVEMYLTKSDVGADGLIVNTPSGRVPVTSGLHYQGIVKGQSNSLVAMSIFDNMIAGFISSNEMLGNYIFGNLDMKDANSEIILYNDRDIINRGPFSCGTTDDNKIQLPTSQVSASRNTTALTNKIVRFFYETEYDIYEKLGNSVTNVTNWVTIVHHQVATIYLNDEIRTCLGSIYVWPTEDPYVSFSRSALLGQFSNSTEPYTGNVGTLLTSREIGGGIATMFSGCSGKKAVCKVDVGSYRPNPSYSWDYTIHVITHEFGHTLGSQHTHACVWDGINGTNNSAIDGCSPPESNGCTRGPIPTPGGGTVMSYCADYDPVAGFVGINFNNGFGPQPKNRIKNNIDFGSSYFCLQTECGGVAPTCPQPISLSTTAISLTGATLNWAAVAGASSYYIELATDNAFANIVHTQTVNGGSSTSVVVSGLMANQQYFWRIRANCSGNTSGLFNSSNFITQVITCPPPAALSANNFGINNVTLNWLPAPGAISYTIQIATDRDFTNIIQTIPIAGGTTNSYLYTGLPFNEWRYWRIRSNCNASVSGPFSDYSFFIISCVPITNLDVYSLGDTYAGLTWGNSYWAQSYYLEVATDYNFNNIVQTHTVPLPTSGQPSIFIQNLTSGQQYYWRVRPNCTGGNVGNFSSGTFTTVQIVPVTFSNFTATPKCDSNWVRLNWRTAQEQNSSHFVVERSDDGSSNFKWVKKIQAAGNSSIPRDYEFYDNYPVNGYCVYRIVAVDLDGSHIISGGRIVNQSCFDIVQPPTTACNSTMTGTLSICDNNSYYYTLTNVPDYTYINWSLWPSAQTAVTMTKEYSNKVKLVRNGSVAASLQLDATMTACNSGATVSKYIMVGNPSLTVQTSNNLNPCTGVLLHHAWINTFPGTLPSNYTWYVAGQYYTTGSSISLTLQPGQNIAYSVSYNGPCGVSQGFGYAQNGGQDPIPERQVKISPNPTTGNFTVSLSKIIYPDPCRTAHTVGSDQIVQVEILDKIGNRKAIFKSGKQNTVNISANKLTLGMYLVKVYTADGSVLTEKLMVAK